MPEISHRRFAGWDHLDADLLEENGDIKWRHAPAWSDDRLEQLINENLASFPETSTILTFARLGLLGGMIDAFRRLGNTPEFVVYRLVEQAKADVRQARASGFEARRKAVEAAEKAAREAEESEALAQQTYASGGGRLSVMAK